MGPVPPPQSGSSDSSVSELSQDGRMSSSPLILSAAEPSADTLIICYLSVKRLLKVMRLHFMLEPEEASAAFIKQHYYSVLATGKTHLNRIGT